MDVPGQGQILLVGDGDFSFTLSLLKKGTFTSSQVTTSNLETLDSIQRHQLAAQNMAALTEMGARVLLEVDARELHVHPVISRDRYQRIIFNFPLADRHNIKKNRALLADFFGSCSQILSDEGQVMVSLCKGQGGTPADEQMRSWHDSWQIQAMASSVGFILTSVLPFDSSVYPEYHSIGFRFQDKSFNTDGALTHVFDKAGVVETGDTVCARGVVEVGGSRYTCSQYVAEKMNRNLLEEINNPLCLMRTQMETSFRCDLQAKIVQDKPDWSILPGHRSRVCVAYTSFTEPPSQLDSDVCPAGDSGDCLRSAKERKNEANLMTMKNAKAASLVHGVVRGSGGDNLDLSQGQCDRNNVLDEKLVMSTFVPDNSETVFILIKANDNNTFESCQFADKSDGRQEIDHPSLEVGEAISCSNIAPSSSNKNCEHDMLDVHDRNGVAQCQVDWSPCETIENEVIGNCIDRVFHCRTSLMENIDELSTNFTSKDGMCSASEDGQSLVTFGKCFLPGPIVPNTLVVKHQMVFMKKIGSNSTNVVHETSSIQPFSEGNDTSGKKSLVAGGNTSPDFGSLSGEDKPSHSIDSQNRQIQSYHSFLNNIDYFISLLKKTNLFSHSSLRVLDTSSAMELKINWYDTVSNIKFLILEPESSDVTKQETQRQESKLVAGVLFTFGCGPDLMFVAILELDNICRAICGIDDPRLLWSQSQRFTGQFQTSIFPRKFSPFSLFPMRFAHDLSFWQNDLEFDLIEMCYIIRYVAGDIVVSVTLIDLYTDPNTNRQSRCYRLQFTSHDLAMPYLASWKLQSLIRLEVSQKLGVTLR